MTDPTLLVRVQQGDIDAIASLLSQSLQPKGIWVRAELLDRNACIVLESTRPPDPDVMETHVRVVLEQAQPIRMSELTLWGWALGEIQPAWERRLLLSSAGPSEDPQPPPLPPKLRASQAQAVPLRSAYLGDRSGNSPTDTFPQPLRIQNRTPRGIGHQPSFSSRKSLQRRPSKQPFVLKWSDFDPVMLVIIGLVALYGFFGSMDPSYDGPFMWLHYPDLAIHETGHLLFMPFGRFLMLLGGSLTQILFPAVFTAYFFKSRQYFSSALTLFWTGQNFMDVAVYMRDAPVRLLPLTVNNIDAHDWWQLFGMMGCLNHAKLIADLTHSVGVLIYIASVVAGAYFAYENNIFNPKNSTSR